MAARAGGLRRWVRQLAASVARRDRSELKLLLVALGVVCLLFAFVDLADEVGEGDTQSFDETVLSALRRADDPSRPIGPEWLRSGALDITALGSPTVLGLAVLSITGFMLLQGMKRTAAFVFIASVGGWFLNSGLKLIFQRARPSVVPHLREVMSLSFPSGHAMTSAAVYLTLGVVTMRAASGRLTKLYCIAVAMLLSFLVGASRVFLGVHYPTDVLAGWMAGLSWALLCWFVEVLIERRAGLKREQEQPRA